MMNNSDVSFRAGHWWEDFDSSPLLKTVQCLWVRLWQRKHGLNGALFCCDKKKLLYWLHIYQHKHETNAIFHVIRFNILWYDTSVFRSENKMLWTNGKKCQQVSLLLFLVKYVKTPKVTVYEWDDIKQSAGQGECFSGSHVRRRPPSLLVNSRESVSLVHYPYTVYAA